MIVVGLTGSIGMGKSTTSGLFADEGVPVNDADGVVHDLYRSEAVEPVGKAFPGTVIDGIIDRTELARQLAARPENFKMLEAIVHPMVRMREKQFIDRHRSLGTRMVLLDIPLLFESGREDSVQSIIVVTCDPAIQKQRVLARPNMTEDKFDLMISRQMPDAEKRKRADFLIDTGYGLDFARQRVKSVIASLEAGKMSEKNGA